MNKKSDKLKVTFKYKISPNYVLYAITGIHGGLNAQGNIIMNLFSERQAIPKEETYEISRDGSLAKHPIKKEKIDSVIRDVLLGISINPQTARAIAKWLNEKAVEHETILNKLKKKDKKWIKNHMQSQ